MPAGRLLDFAIIREGAEIGYHRIRFAREDGGLLVDIDVDVRVTALSLTLYRFRHRAREVWDGGKLVRLDSETDEDGTPHSLSVVEQGDKYVVTHNGATTRVQSGQIPTSLWNRAAIERSTLLDSLRGDLMPTTVTRLGPGRLNVQGHDLEVEGYDIDARPDFKRRIWFDNAGRLVAVRLEGRDGSQIAYRLR